MTTTKLRKRQIDTDEGNDDVEEVVKHTTFRRALLRTGGVLWMLL